MRYFPAVIAAFVLSVLATVSVTPAAIAETTTVTLTVTTGSLYLNTSSGAVTDQRGTSGGWTSTKNTAIGDDGTITKTTSVL